MMVSVKAFQKQLAMHRSHVRPAELKEERKTDQPALRETLTGLQEHRKLSGTHIIEVHFRSSRPVFSGGFQQMAANATDPIQELLMVPDEQFENTKETVTQMIRTMDAQNKNSLALSCKQILGYAMQTPRGATRAAEIVDVLQHEASEIFKFESIIHWLNFLLPHNYFDQLYSPLSWTQIFHLGIFLGTLYGLFRGEPLQGMISHYLRQTLWCLAHDHSPEGPDHFRVIFEISCGLNLPTM
ncbi:hypothetical protein M514_28254 [Trichuris suis]|uniref:Uncharacterized protein n=1 Tax=Trichuris suis TaxID=68888 RepID=A0A085MQS1_9BILA|nr:hypothetical protein M514_28254 [Trichuris suis]